jgi:integrase
MFTLASKNTQKRGTVKTARLMGQKPPLKPKHVWAVRTRLQLADSTRNLALFNLAIDSKLRACDLVRIRVKDVTQAGTAASRAMVMQKKTHRPVQFEITESTRVALDDWIREKALRPEDFLFPSRIRANDHISTRQYARLLRHWLSDIGLDASLYGTHSLRRTKASLIYRRTKNIRAVQILLGHSKLESTVRYLGVEIDDALEIAEQTEI